MASAILRLLAGSPSASLSDGLAFGVSIGAYGLLGIPYNNNNNNNIDNNNNNKKI